MNKQLAQLTALLILCALPSAAQKKATTHARGKAPAKAIRFQGAPQFAPEELLAAAGLKANTQPKTSEVKAGAKLLSDTGFFTAVKFASDSKGLVFTLTPTSDLYPLHLDNLPLKPGKDLDSQLQRRFPLYHGLLPASGSTDDGICQALQEMLAAAGVKATVKATLTSGVGPKKITVVNFTIPAPAVRIGPIEVAGVSAAMQSKVSNLIAGQTGNGFDTENSAIGLQHAFLDLYQDLDYAAVEVDVAEVDPPIVSDQAIDIRYRVTVKEGGIYKLGMIGYPANAAVPRAQVEKVLAKYQAGAGRPFDLFQQAVRDAHHAAGYMDCAVASHASFNEATHIVNYTLDVTSGPQYRMGTVQFDGAPDAMAAKLTRQWKMAPGDVFDESYVSGFAATAQKKDKQLAKWLQSVITTFDVKPDPATQKVNCVLHFAKAVQSGR